MKKFFCVILVSACSGCCSAQRGIISNTYDSFKNYNVQSVTLGELESNSSALGVFFGTPMSFRVAGNFCKDQADHQPANYYISLNISSVAMQLPAQVKEGNQVIFVVDGETYEFTIKDIKGGPILGGVVECCKIGPLPNQMLASIQKAKEVKFKIYGIYTEIEGRIAAPALAEMNKLITSSK